ncbi:hypothetical protein KP509_05G064600 [Ceratopteris richardii]|uniref:Uncharacterized protein n=1 Tax=Ceratopteris richardii TaxID=49495 RepID=A0A8T2UMB6_CERRI|nr:hypothetical protein KP509_05G064600 [Ceratopteris richardii]
MDEKVSIGRKRSEQKSSTSMLERFCLTGCREYVGGIDFNQVCWHRVTLCLQGGSIDVFCNNRKQRIWYFHSRNKVYITYMEERFRFGRGMEFRACWKSVKGNEKGNNDCRTPAKRSGEVIVLCASLQSSLASIVGISVNTKEFFASSRRALSQTGEASASARRSQSSARSITIKGGSIVPSLDSKFARNRRIMATSSSGTHWSVVHAALSVSSSHCSSSHCASSRCCREACALARGSGPPAGAITERFREDRVAIVWRTSSGLVIPCEKSLNLHYRGMHNGTGCVLEKTTPHVKS